MILLQSFLKLKLLGLDFSNAIEQLIIFAIELYPNYWTLTNNLRLKRIQYIGHKIKRKRGFSLWAENPIIVNLKWLQFNWYWKRIC